MNCRDKYRLRHKHRRKVACTDKMVLEANRRHTLGLPVRDVFVARGAAVQGLVWLYYVHPNGSEHFLGEIRESVARQHIGRRLTANCGLDGNITRPLLWESKV